MSRASEWAKVCRTTEERRPPRFDTPPSDEGRIGARVDDRGEMEYWIANTPTLAMWRAFARWIIDTFDEQTR